jgi:hypothetical protein
MYKQRLANAQNAKAAEEIRRRTGPLFRVSGYTKDLNVKNLTNLRREVRILIDHLECMYDYKAQIRTLDRFLSVDVDWSIVTDPENSREYLDEPEDKELKKTKRALLFTFVCYKRQLESVVSQIRNAFYRHDLSNDDQEGVRWHKIAWTVINADLRNQACHCYRCAAEMGHDEFSSRKWWYAAWPAVKGVLEEARDLEECLYRTILVIEKEYVTTTPPAPFLRRQQPPRDVGITAQPRSLLDPIVDYIDRTNRIILLYIHRGAEQLARATDVWVPVDTNQADSNADWHSQPSLYNGSLHTSEVQSNSEGTDVVGTDSVLISIGTNEDVIGEGEDVIGEGEDVIGEGEDVVDESVIDEDALYEDANENAIDEENPMDEDTIDEDTMYGDSIDDNVINKNSVQKYRTSNDVMDKHTISKDAINEEAIGKDVIDEHGVHKENIIAQRTFPKERGHGLTDQPMSDRLIGSHA